MGHVSARYDWSRLGEMSLSERVEHLQWLVESMTTPEPDVVAIDLPPQESRVAGLLMHAKGKTVSRERLFTAAMCDRDLDSWSGSEFSLPRILVYRIRPKLAPLGYLIETVRGVGYRLTTRDE
jgi:DNA-binding response OmpR family regulator